MFLFNGIISSVGENPVTVMSQPKKRGRPRGSKNKTRPDSSRPSCPVDKAPRGRGRGRPRGRGRGRGRGLSAAIHPPPSLSISELDVELDSAVER